MQIYSSELFEALIFDLLISLLLFRDKDFAQYVSGQRPYGAKQSGGAPRPPCSQINLRPSTTSSSKCHLSGYSCRDTLQEISVPCWLLLFLYIFKSFLFYNTNKWMFLQFSQGHIRAVCICSYMSPMYVRIFFPHLYKVSSLFYSSRHRHTIFTHWSFDLLFLEKTLDKAVSEQYLPLCNTVSR